MGVLSGLIRKREAAAANPAKAANEAPKRRPTLAALANLAARPSASEPPPLDALAEVRQLVEEIARRAPSYWTPEDVEDAVNGTASDIDAALQCFREIAAHYRRLQ